MSVDFELDVKPRSDTGKGASRRLRRQGLVPGIIYGGHQEPSMITVVHNELVQHLEHEAFYSHILDMKLGDKAEKVVLKDLQRHPSKPFVMHIDFQRVKADEKIRMQVPLHFVNEEKCVGVKLGGAISHTITEVEISCLPKDLPEYIEVDMGPLEVGNIVHLSELKMPEGVELAHAPDPDLPVVNVHGGHAEMEAAPGEGGGEEGQGAD